MGRSGGSGGAKRRSDFDRVLRRHIESILKKSCVTVDELVNHLRSTYPHYSRKPEKPLSDYVRRVLQNSGTQNDAMDDSNDDDGDSTPVVKKRRKFDSSRRGDVANNSSSSLLSSLSCSDEEASTSEDVVIYGGKVETESDLMKSMLRESLRSKSKGEAVELEIVDNKDAKKAKSVNEGSKLGGVDDKNKNYSGDNKMNGPMFKDLGGMSGLIEELNMDVIFPLLHPQVPCDLRVAGILLHGPPGCGKTTLACAIANEARVPLYKVSSSELVSGVSGASEKNIRELFSKAYRTAPSIVFIDEIDAIASKRENLRRAMERRIVTQLMTCMDDSHRPVKPMDENENSEASGYVLVIGATNRLDALDPALRRPGRFDCEIELGVPDESTRMEILSVLTHKLKFEDAIDLEKIARATPGFAGSDLADLAKQAGKLAMRRFLYERKAELSKGPDHSEDWLRQPLSHDELGKLCIRRMVDLEEAAKMVQPSSKREGFSAVPNVKWDDVGGFHLLRQEFDLGIVRRIKFPKCYEDMGLNLAAGFLLYGPPGCGKTLIAKAVANEAGANFIHIKGPELMNKYVGESELAVRTIFSRARKCSPCILFFDEVDALTTRRGKEEGGAGVVKRLVNQLLIELDGGEQRRGIYVIGATNRPDVMDEALLRPGRFGKLLYVPLPSPDERGMILKALARKKPVDANVDLMALGRDRACENFSGADLSALMDAAATAALREIWASQNQSCDDVKCMIKIEHFKIALEETRPSVSKEQIQGYKSLAARFCAK